MEFVITRVYLEHFGRFHHKEICFAPGMNIIYGPNETGKTTVCRFLSAMLFGLERQRGRAAKDDLYIRCQPWELGGYSGSMDFSFAGKEYRLYRSFSTAEKKAVLTELSTGAEKELGEESLFTALKIKREALWQRAFCVGERNMQQTQTLLLLLQDFMTEEAGESGSSFHQACARLEKQQKEWKKERQEEAIAHLDRLLQEEEAVKERLCRCREAAKALQEQKEEKERKWRECEERRENCLSYRKCRRQFVKGSILGSIALLAGLLGLLLKEAGATAALCFLLAGGAFVWARPDRLLINRKMKTGREKETLAQCALEEERLKSEEEACTAAIWRLAGEEAMLEEQLLSYEQRAGERERLYEKHKKAETELKALQTAERVLQEAAGRLQQQKKAAFHRLLSDYTARLTQGAHESAYVNEQAQIKLLIGEQYREGKLLSAGTAEQLAFSLRLAAGELSCKEEGLPWILDDAFVYFDDARCLAALQTLWKTGGQVLVFTCHTREERLLQEEQVSYHEITLV